MNLSHVIIIKGKSKKKCQGRPRENMAPGQGVQAGLLTKGTMWLTEDAGSGTQTALGGRQADVLSAPSLAV